MKYYFLYFFILLNINKIKAQDNVFSQPNGAPMYLNPALTGSTEQGRAMLLSRFQYPKVGGTFINNAFSFDYNANDANSGFGLLVMNSQAGQAGIRASSITLNYAYHVALSEEWQMKLGISAGYNNQSIGFFNYIFGDQLNSSGTISPTAEALNKTKMTYLDLSSGIFLHNKNIWVGFAAHHLNEPNRSLFDKNYQLPRRFSLQLGTRMEINEYNTITPQANVRDQKGLYQADLGVLWSSGVLEAGLWYKNMPISKTANSSLAAVVSFGVQKMRFTYSYDYVFGKLQGLGGAHEVGLSFSFGEWRGYRKKYVHCPIFMENDIDL